jgi:hypothetical protein
VPFDSPDLNLGDELLKDVGSGKIRLPDFQRDLEFPRPVAPEATGLFEKCVLTDGDRGELTTRDADLAYPQGSSARSFAVPCP